MDEVGTVPKRVSYEVIWGEVQRGDYTITNVEGNFTKLVITCDESQDIYKASWPYDLSQLYVLRTISCCKLNAFTSLKLPISTTIS